MYGWSDSDPDSGWPHRPKNRARIDSDTILRSELNLTKPTCKVRFALTYKLLKDIISSRCRISNSSVVFLFLKGNVLTLKVF